MANKSGHFAKIGAIVGTAILPVVGGIATLTSQRARDVQNAFIKEYDGAKYTGIVAAFSVLYGAVGAGFGALIGSTVKDEKVVRELPDVSRFQQDGSNTVKPQASQNGVGQAAKTESGMFRDKPGSTTVTENATAQNVHPAAQNVQM